MDITRRSLLAAAALPGVVAGSARDQSKALQAAIIAAEAQGADVFLPAGKYHASGLLITKPLRFAGVPGATHILGNGEILVVQAARNVTLSGLSFTAAAGAVPATSKALVSAVEAENLTIRDCRFTGESPAGGLALHGCSGRVSGNQVSYFETTGILALDSTGLEISGNTVSDIGNNGIQIWR